MKKTPKNSSKKETPKEKEKEQETEKEKEISLIEKWNEHMKIIKKKTGIPGEIVIFVIIVTLIIVYLNIFDADALITNLVGTIYPVFWTMKSIETNSNDDDDDKHWLTYWICFAFFNLIETFSGFILRFIPFYFFLKIIFLIWLFMPNSHGAILVYQLLVVRIFKSFAKDIDKATNSVKNYTNEFVKNDNFDGYQNFKKGLDGYFRKRSESTNHKLNKTMNDIDFNKELRNLNKIEHNLTYKRNNKNSVSNLKKGNFDNEFEKLKKD